MAIQDDTDQGVEKNDLCAEIIHQPIPDMAGTEPRLNSFERAVWLCRELRAYPMPSITPEGNGALGLDWDEAADRVLAITLDDQNWVGYSYLVGEFKACGRIAPIAVVAMIKEVLRLIYPQIGSGTQPLSEASTNTAQERSAEKP
jgi:hypothetical protein